MEREASIETFTLDQLNEYRLNLMDQLNEVQDDVRTIKHHLEFPIDDSVEKRVRTSTALRHKQREVSSIIRKLTEVKVQITKLERNGFMEAARRILDPELFDAIKKEAGL